MRTLAFLAILATSPLAAAEADQTCQDLIAALPKLKGDALVKSKLLGTSYKELFDTCDQHDTFAGYPLGGHVNKKGKYIPIDVQPT